MSNLQENLKPYSRAMAKLLSKSVIERDSTHWDNLIHYQTEIQEYISQIGLELIVKKDEGYAFIKQFEDSEGNTLGLVQRRQIGFETSIVLIVLRQSLEDFDSNPTQYQVGEKFITRTEIKDELELFLLEGYNKLKFQKDLDKYINNAVELGYLKEVTTQGGEIKYQIHRIIKEKITLDILHEFRHGLQELL